MVFHSYLICFMLWDRLLLQGLISKLRSSCFNFLNTGIIAMHHQSNLYWSNLIIHQNYFICSPPALSGRLSKRFLQFSCVCMSVNVHCHRGHMFRCWLSPSNVTSGDWPQAVILEWQVKYLNPQRHLDGPRNFSDSKALLPSELNLTRKNGANFHSIELLMREGDVFI